MDDSFIGREPELKLLRRAYDGREPSLIPVYGRRRVGKSELILRSLEGRRALYFVGKTAPASMQIREFLGEAARVLGEPLLASQNVSDWGQALKLVEDRWPRDEKIILAIDEFQWVAGASPELPSIIQAAWDARWRKGSRLALILCGSLIGFMEREVLGKNSPLFGRRTAQILLRPFDYRTAAGFHPRWSHRERAQAYFVCGGVPLYLRAFDPERSVAQNIERALLDEFAPLYREPEFLLREELRDVQNYYAVLFAVALGHGTYKDIARETGLPERSLHYWVEQLVSLGYVARRYPLVHGRPTRTQLRFAIDDPLLRFWFRFVFPHVSYIQHMGPARSFRDLVRPELDAYFGGCFERMCREAMPRLYERAGVQSTFRVGEYWNRDLQIDVVSVRSDGWVDLGECKWGPIQSRPGVERALDAAARAWPNTEGATIARHGFVRELPPKFQRNRSDRVQWHDLRDLYE